MASAYADIGAALDRGDRSAALATGTICGGDYDTWSALVHLRFAQNTTDETAKADRDYADALSPEAADLETGAEAPAAGGSAPGRAWPRWSGEHALRLWDTDVTTFDPAIKPDLEEEARLSRPLYRTAGLGETGDRRTDGQSRRTGSLAEDPDRSVRHEAERVRWAFFAATCATNWMTLYDQLVQLRHGMAVSWGFRPTRRWDTGGCGGWITDRTMSPVTASRWFDHVVPLVGRLLEARRAENGWDRLRFWDEALIDPDGNPKPAGDHDVLVRCRQAMFDGMDARLAGFYRLMRDGGFMDLKNRPGKAGGGFCTSFPTVGHAVHLRQLQRHASRYRRVHA